MGTLKENIQSNRGQILYYTGVFLVALLRSVTNSILTLIPDVWWGKALTEILTYGLLFFTIIAPYIFGKDAKLAQVKAERTANGKELERILIENEGYRVTNKLANDLLAENNLKQIIYTPNGSIATEKLPEPPAKLV